MTTPTPTAQGAAMTEERGLRHGYELNEYREIGCEFCDGGWVEVGGHGYDHITGAQLTHSLRCLTCHGTGRQTVVVEPISMEDLDYAGN